MTYFIAAIAIFFTCSAICYLLEVDGIFFSGIILFGLVSLVSLYAYDNNYYTASGVLKSLNDYQSHQVVVFNDAKTFYTESGIDLSDSVGKQVTLTCPGRVGDAVNDQKLCKINSVE